MYLYQVAAFHKYQADNFHKMPYRIEHCNRLSSIGHTTYWSEDTTQHETSKE